MGRSYSRINWSGFADIEVIYVKNRDVTDYEIEELQTIANPSEKVQLILLCWENGNAEGLKSIGYTDSQIAKMKFPKKQG